MFGPMKEPVEQTFPEDARFYLEREYENRRTRRPHYSLRAYARDLELGPSSLTDFLKARQGFSHERAITIATKLKLNSEHTKHFCDLISVRFSRKIADRKLAKIRISSRTRDFPSYVSLDLYKTVADWPHFAVLELLEIDAKYSDSLLIATALGISKKEAKETWERLVRTKMVAEKDGVWAPASEDSFGGDETPSQAIRFHHTRLLKLALNSLETQSMEEREFRSWVFSFRKEDLPRMRSELSKAFLDVIAKYAGADGRDSVYAGAFQLFNLVKKATK
jgi:uncharacterized protein (TIGR02147 family)